MMCTLGNILFESNLYVKLSFKGIFETRLLVARNNAVYIANLAEKYLVVTGNY